MKQTKGIADGVGGWAESGICPAEYARELMSAARSAAEGIAPRRVTVESLAAERRGGGGGGGGGENEKVNSSPSSFSSFGVPLSCVEAAGGGAPAPPVSSPPPASAVAPLAEEKREEEDGGFYGEDGGVASLESLLSSPSSASSASSPRPPQQQPSRIPTAALAAAHAAVRLPGSATACVATLDPATGTLHGISVGDSAVLVVRDNFLLFRSTPTSHSFDCPRQLAAAPEHVEWSDGVEDGEAFEVEGLEEGKREGVCFSFSVVEFFLTFFSPTSKKKSKKRTLFSFPSSPPPAKNN